MRVVTINGNAVAGDPIIRGGSGGVTIKYDPVCCRFPGVEDTHWPYILDENQRIKAYSANVSPNDFLSVQLFYQPGISASGISNFDDLKDWIAATFPCIRYGIAASGSDIIPSSTYNTGKSISDFQTNFQPSYRGVFGPQICDDLLLTDTVNVWKEWPDRNLAGNGYRTFQLRTFASRARAQIIKGLQNICSIAGEAGASHLFIDDISFGLFNPDEQDTNTRHALPAQLAQYRDAAHQCGLPIIGNISRLSYESEALSFATGSSADALFFEITFGTASGETDDVIDKLSLGTNLADHFRHMYGMTSGGAMVAYLCTQGHSQDYDDMMDFCTALAMMVGRSLVYRTVTQPIPASADWPVDLGARVGLPVFSGAGDIATCEFERGALQVDATNITATKL